MKAKVVIVEGPCREFDQYVFRIEKHNDAVEFASGWIEAVADLFQDVGDKLTVEIRIEEWEEDDLPEGI